MGSGAAAAGVASRVSALTVCKVGQVPIHTQGMSVQERMPVIQYWHAEEPPQPIVELMETFKAHIPGARHLLFNEVTAADFIAEHFSSREVAAFRACAEPAGQADYLRYCAGYVLGGLCVDADARCLSDFSQLVSQLDRGIVFGQRDPLPRRVPGLPQWPYQVGPYKTLINTIFAFRQPRDPMLALAIEVATANIEQRVADGPIGVLLTAGPGVFTSLYLLSHLGSMDAFLEYANHSLLRPSAGLFCEVIGDDARVRQALAGVDMAAFEDILGVRIEHVGIPKDMRKENHWSRAGSIFRA